MTVEDPEEFLVAGGGSLSRHPAVFSADGQHVLVPMGTSVEVYSTTTGIKLTTLIGNTSDVTSVVASDNPRQVCFKGCMFNF